MSNLQECTRAGPAGLARYLPRLNSQSWRMPAAVWSFFPSASPLVRPGPGRLELIAQEKTARILYLSVTHRTSRSFLIEQEKLLVALHVQLRHSKRSRSQHILPSCRTAALHSTRKPFCSKLTSYVSGPWAGGIASAPRQT